jgi:hypothetical protein
MTVITDTALSVFREQAINYLPACVYEALSYSALHPVKLLIFSLRLSRQF